MVIQARVFPTPTFIVTYLSAKVAHCFLALGNDAQTAVYAEQSLKMNTDYVRGRTFNLLMLATTRAADEPEEAVRVGGVALDLVEGLQSQRVLTYLRRLRHRLRPYEDLPEVEELAVRVREVIPE